LTGALANNKKHGKTYLRRIVENRQMYLFLILPLIWLIIFKYGPMYGAQIAFKNYRPADGIWDSQFVGLEQFRKFFDSVYFSRTVGNTVVLSLYSIVVGFPIPIIFALLLNSVRSKKWKSAIENVTYMPHFISVVVVCGMLVQFCSTQGLFNSILTFFTGKEGKNLLMQSGWFRPIYIGSGIWKGIGWNSILYIAAIHGIDQSQYEAAKIDGAGRFAQAIFITIPCMAPTIIIKLIFHMGDMMSIGFEKVFLLQNDATLQVSEVISTYTYKTGLKGMKYSLSTAINLFDTVINLVLLLTANALARKFSETSLF
jgi:putative aldouronate transport system permease protein